MAEYYSTRHIAQRQRAYVKAESRRIRLAGVRAKAVVFYKSDSAPMSYLRAFSWADITVLMIKLKKAEDGYSVLQKHISDSSVHGIIIADEGEEKMYAMRNMLPPEKDILCEGAGAVAAALCSVPGAYKPCFSDAVMRMMRYSAVEYSGKHIALFGVGNTVRALGFMLMNAGSHVSLCPTANAESRRIAERADIIITKLDMPNSINAAFMNEKQIIIDLGHNTAPNGKVSGDVVLRDAEKFVKAIFIGQENAFFELADYIAAEHVLRSAAITLIRERK